MKDIVLKLEDVSIGVRGTKEPLTHHVNIAMQKGKVTALVGESGSGKTITAMSIAGLLNPALKVKSGKCLLGDTDLYALSEAELQKFRGKKIAVVFQEPMTALNPLHTVHKQISEMLETHGDYTKSEKDKRILDLLNLVKIPDAKRRMTSYPHELSGGQRQRIMIAMALANNPDILLLDEPTTALDVTVQAEILLLLKEIREKIGTSMLLISHDLNMVARTSDYIYVMKNGEVVEEGETETVFYAPSHDYTRYLIDAIPKNAPDPAPENTAELVRGELINVKYPIKSGLLRRTTGYVHAVKDISFGLRAGETIGIVGESGSGKSTLASALLHLTQYEGLIKIQGVVPKTLSARDLRQFRKSFQPIFQDPYAALSPRMNIRQILEEGLDLHFPNMQKDKKYQLICETLRDTGMDPDICLSRYPHEFSGGQRQRIAIARSVVVRPAILILDEPTSALDRTVQKQVLELLENLQKKYAMAFIFISHDLSVIRAVSHHIMVMKDGVVIESGSGKDVFDNPQTDYTKSLLHSSLFSDFR